MITLINEAMFYPFIIIAGVIAYLSRDTYFKWIGLTLFLEFIFASAYEAYIFNSKIVFEEYRDLAQFFGYRMVIQAIFTVIYIHLQCRPLIIISIMLMFVFGSSTIISLYNIDVAYYESIMLALTVSQLIAGFGGAIGGYSYLFNHLWDRFIDSRYKRLHK